jgi:hypothetical protein
MHNYNGYFANNDGTGYSGGDGNWFTGILSSASYSGPSGYTGFAATAPLYAEATIWVPQLAASDHPNATGLWPAFVLYTAANPWTNIDLAEYDVLEALSGDYHQYDGYTHDWYNGSQSVAGHTNGGGVLIKPGYDISNGWHKFGIWIRLDSSSPTGGLATYYLDGVAVETTNAISPNLPVYLNLVLAAGGGWPVSLTPNSDWTGNGVDHPYIMKVSSVRCFTSF